MEPKELITAKEAALLFTMSINAFRIFVHRNRGKVKKLKLGKRKTYFYRTNLLEQLREE
jgi:hypothetical protein